jgi:signal transduction histidine kinase
VELALYRMVQEAINNVIRHAQAKQAAIDLVFSAQALNIQVADDGVGFDVPKSPAEFAPNGHFGLLGLYERAQLIGAQLDIQSDPRTGTKLSIFLSQKAKKPKQ